MLGRLILRSSRHRWRRMALTILTAAIAVVPLAVQLQLSQEVEKALQEDLDAFGPNLVVSPEGGVPGSLGSQRMDQAVAQEVLALPQAQAVSAWAPFLFGSAALVNDSAAPVGPQGNATVVVIGTDLTTVGTLHPWWKVDRGWPDAGEAHAIVGAALLRSHNLSQGQGLNLSGVGGNLTVRVWGTLTTGGGEEQALLVALPTAQRLLAAPRQVDILGLRVRVFADLGPLDDAIDAHPALEGRTVQRLIEGDRQVLSAVQLQLTLLGALTLATTGLAALAIATSALLDRRAEGGLLLSMGCKPRQAGAILGGDLVLAGAIGGGVGYVLATALAWQLGHVLFGVVVMPLPAVLGLATGMGALEMAVATGASSLSLGRRTPLDSLREG